MKRGLAVLIVLLLTAPGPALTGAVEHPETPPNTDSYTTGRPVDDVTVHASGGRVSLLVSDDNPEGTSLVIDRDWLRDKIGKPIEFVRFFDDGNLISSYKRTPEHIIIQIPHFSTQNITATAVDAQFEVTGSATGQSTTRVINYDVNETGIGVLEIHGQGTREGSQRVDQFYSQVDNRTFRWEMGEIPRNVTLKIEGHGSKLGPEYNKSFAGVSDGETVFFDLVAKDYTPNVTLLGIGEKHGSVVEKGIFVGQADGDQQTLTFDYDQNNGSVVFVGNTTTETHNTTFTEDFSSLETYEHQNVTVENGKLVLGTYTDESTTVTDDFEDGDLSEYSGDVDAASIKTSGAPAGANHLDINHQNWNEQAIYDYNAPNAPAPGGNFSFYMRYDSGAGDGYNSSDEKVLMRYRGMCGMKIAGCL